jgi:hypothetical protein
MKRNQLLFSLLLVFIMLGLMVQAQDCSFYPVRAGAIMGYQSIDAKGKITGTSRITILGKDQQGNATVYNVKSESFDEKNKPLTTNEYAMKCEDGVFSVDMKSMIDPKSMEGFKDMEITFSGTDMTYPQSLSVGQSLPDANVTMGAATGGLSLMKMTINITNRKVEALESVTVPAGTFECYKITYELESKMGIKVLTNGVQWINRGAGAVKSESYDKKGKSLGSTILNEFKP